MSNYRLSNLARQDLEAIWLYTHETWSTKQADKYIRAILATLRGLAQGVVHSRIYDELAGIFLARAQSHFLFYNVDDEGLFVLRILHTSQEPELHL